MGFGILAIASSQLKCLSDSLPLESENFWKTMSSFDLTITHPDHVIGVSFS